MSSNWQWRTVDYWVQWYADMASNPGFKHYVWHRVNEMAKESDMWADLPALFLERVKHDSTATKPQV